MSRPIPDYGDHMTAAEFEIACRSGSFVNDDGSGYYADADSMTDKRVDCREFRNGTWDTSHTHVVWFNK